MFDAFQTLFSGTSMVAGAALRAEEDALLRLSLQGDEPVERFVRGREQRVGWMLWALTPQRLLCLPLSRKRSLRAHPHSSIERVEALMGKWGATLRVHAAATREVIFAADPAMSDDFLALLATYCPSVTPPERLVTPAPPPATDAIPPATQAYPTTSDTAAAASAGTDSEHLLDGLRQAADLRDKGYLSDEEFVALKRRLLGL